MWIISAPVKILSSIISTVTLGYASGIVTRTSVKTWYPSLKKPWFTPPNWVFPVAWGTLYALMGTAAGLIWTRLDAGGNLATQGLKYFAVQLGLNMLWSCLFFGLKSPVAAFVEVLFLWEMIYKTWRIFDEVDKTAGWLMVPYLMWVTYATVLNGSICWLNRP